MNAVITDRKTWDNTASVFKAVVTMTSDYYAFGMDMPNTNRINSDYRYLYNGMEADKEVSGDGNSYTTEFRQYDPRLGRWKSLDPKKHWFTSMSPYCYASNTPISAKDNNGLYTIFVNGYIYGSKRGKDDDIKPLKPYWSKRGSQFIDGAHQYFGDGIGQYVNGTGNSIFSTATTRQSYGRTLGKQTAKALIVVIQNLNKDDDPNNDVTELNFVTHSMGAAVAEGMIEEFMKHPELKKLLENGEIVHFSACDADKIKISDNSSELKRTQLNYRGDFTLAQADAGSGLTGGYQIPGVKRFGVVKSDLKLMHPKANQSKLWDFHYDSKTYGYNWDFIKKLDQKISERTTPSEEPVYLEYEDINPIEDTILDVKTNDKG